MRDSFNEGPLAAGPLLELGETSDDVTVCPTHLRFVPCRECLPGQERYATDDVTVERVRRYQAGELEGPPGAQPTPQASAPAVTVVKAADYDADWKSYDVRVDGVKVGSVVYGYSRVGSGWMFTSLGACYPTRARAVTALLTALRRAATSAAVTDE